MEFHQPVMVEEAIDFLKPKSAGLYVDATSGTGGHTQAILDASFPKGQVLAFDLDEEALARAKKRLAAYGSRIKFFHKNYSEIMSALREEKITQVDGILLDLGVSSLQIDSASRGFSFQKDGPLDMRMDQSRPLTAKDLIEFSSEAEIARIIFEFGEEKLSRRIAAGLTKAKSKEKINSTLKLRKIIENVLRGRPPKVILCAVQKTFQALRIAVNQELENLKKALEISLEILRPQARLLVISFHSLEDRIVKEFFKTEARDCLCPPKTPVCLCRHRARLRKITKKPITPKKEEILLNPRAGSAKMRVAERI